MKTKIFKGLLFIFLISLASCDWIDEELNVDPTSPKEVRLNVILPTTQAGSSYVLGGDIYRITSCITQHFIGQGRQHSGYYNYSLDESVFDNAWTTMYTGPMVDLYLMIDAARVGGSPHYQGVAEILLAYNIAYWTDMMGDIPYSEAFQGNAKPNPKYDTQESIYGELFKLLDSSLIHLAATSSVFKPGSDDFMYGGDLALWTKAAYTLKARLYLHVNNIPLALDNVKKGFTDNADDLQFVHGEAGNEANPLFQFTEQRAGDIGVGGMILSLMNPLSDPRRDAYCIADDNGEYKQGADIGPYYNSAGSPVPFLTYAEAKFIEAECEFRNGNKGGAYTAYIDAIKASCAKFGVAAADIDTYVAQAAVGLGGDANSITLKNIMEQKYIALYFQFESWSDYRRTGFPELVPTSGSTVPVRQYYAQSERLFNYDELMKTGYTQNEAWIMTNKVWWDATKW
jgi:hypothetical protein